MSKRAIAWMLIVVFITVLAVLPFVVSSRPESKAYDCSEDPVLFKRNLNALNDTRTLEGDFFIGTGKISGAYVYMVNIELEDGGLYTTELSDDDAVIIYEHSGQESYIIKKRTTKPECWPDDPINWEDQVIYSRTWYEIHVPEGTIASLTELDLK